MLAFSNFKVSILRMNMKRILILLCLIFLENVLSAQSGCVSFPQDTVLLCTDGTPVLLPIPQPIGGQFTTAGIISINEMDNYFNTTDISAGNYNIVYSYSGPGCSGADTLVAVVVQSGIIEVIGEDTICLGDTLRMATTKNELVYWQQSIDSNQQVFDSVAYYLPVESGYINYDYSYLIDNFNSCNVRKNFFVEVNRFEPGPVLVGSDYSCGGTQEQYNLLPETLNNGQEYSWIWNNGSLDNFIDTVLYESGSISVDITSANGCDTTLSIDLQISVFPELILDANYYEICQGDELYLNPYGGAYYLIGDSLYPSNEQLTLFPQSDTIIQIVSLPVDLNNGCADSASIEVRIFPYPSISITSLDTICRGDTITASASGAELYEWAVYQNSLLYPPLSTSNSLVFAPDSTRMIFVRGFQYICYRDTILEAFVYQLPEVEIITQGVFCQDSNMVFNATGASIYSWANGSDVFTFDEVLLYDTTFVLYGYDSTTTCSNYDTLEVFVNDNPMVSISAPDSVCAGQEFTLVAEGAVYYSWDNGSDSAMLNLSIQGDQVFTLTGINEFGCVGRDIQTVRSIAPPILLVAPDAEICLGDSVNIWVYSDAYYSPQLIDGNQMFFPSADTTLYFNAVNDLGCTSQAFIHVEVRPLPSVVITGNSNACPGDALTFNAQGAQQFYWSVNATGSSAEIIVVQDSLVYVTGVSDFGCISTTSFEVNMRDIPESAIVGDDLICSGGTSVFQGLGEYEMLWEGVIVDSQLVLSNIVADTLIQVQVTNEFGCQAYFERWLRVAELNPDVTILGDDSLCFGESTILYAAGDAIFYWWDSIPANSVELNFLTNDTTISIRVENELGCDTTFQVLVEVFDYPQLSLADVLFSCEGQWVTVESNSNVPVFWDDGIIAPYRQYYLQSDTVVSAHALGINNCITYDTALISIAENPIVTAQAPIDVACEGDTITLTAEGAETYQWSNGAFGNQINVAAELFQNYSVIGFSFEGCSGSSSVSPQVAPNVAVQVNFTTDTTCLFGGNFSLVLSPSGGTLSGDGVLNGIFNPSSDGYYSVEYSVESSGGCIASGSDAIYVESCAVGVSEGFDEILDPFPNPGNGMLRWDTSIRSAIVTDLFGRVVWTGSVNSGVLDLQNLPNGTYLIVGTDQLSVSHMVKFVKHSDN